MIVFFVKEEKKAYLKQIASYEKVVKFDEIYDPGDGYQYKFSINKENNTIEYFTKSNTGKDFVKVNPNSSDGDQKLIGLSVVNKLGHLEGELQENVEAILKQNRIKKYRLREEAKQLKLALEAQKTAPPLVVETDEKRNVASLSSGVFDNVNNYLNDKITFNYEEIFIETDKKIKLKSWFIKKDLDKFKTILIFHGNAGNLFNRVYKLNTLNKLEVNILLI